MVSSLVLDAFDLVVPDLHDELSRHIDAYLNEIYVANPSSAAATPGTYPYAFSMNTPCKLASALTDLGVRALARDTSGTPSSALTTSAHVLRWAFYSRTSRQSGPLHH